MRDYLKTLIQKQNLTRIQAYNVLSQLATYPIEQQAAFLALLARKNESIDEIQGALDFILEQSTLVHSPFDIIDMVGTGGDGLNTFNISTAASLVIASCDVYVAKNGGRSSTSKSGSVDVLEALGVPIKQTAQACLHDLTTHKYTFLSGPVFNTSLKSFASLRKNLNIPTLFNILGPLLNPMQPKRQVIGVYRRELLSPMAHILKARNSQHALVVHSQDGMDELSVSAPTHILELNHGKITEYTITPEDIGLKRAPLEEIIAGDAAENAAIIRGIFEGRITGAKLDVVLLNSAAGLLAADRVIHLSDGVAIARMMIASGKTAAFLKSLQS